MRENDLYPSGRRSPTLMAYLSLECVLEFSSMHNCCTKDEHFFSVCIIIHHMVI